jgi:hypothetical protein
MRKIGQPNQKSTAERGRFFDNLASQLNGALGAPFFLELQQREDQDRGGQKRAQL